MMRLRRSDVEEEVHDVAVLNDVVLAFGAHLAGFLSALFTLEGNEVFVGDRLGADEAAFEVGVDDAGGLRGGVALVDRPGADFLDAGREVGLQAEQVVARADDAVEARFGHAHVCEEHFLVLVVEVGDVGLGLGADGHDGGVLGGGEFTHGVEQRIVFKAIIKITRRSINYKKQLNFSDSYIRIEV